jgi:uncharacterized protein
MSGTQAAQKGAAEPSMDDILASIRKILNEDDGGAPPPAPVPVRAAEEPLVLTPDMLVDGPGTDDIVVDVEELPPPAPPVVVAAPPPPEPAAPFPDAGALLAPAAAAAAGASLGQLLRAVSQDRNATILRSANPSIEDVVREEMRPMLKEWLDTHLPGIVERAVQAEIERVVARSA